MLRRPTSSFLLTCALVSLPFQAINLFASAPAPNVIASRSANGRFLVYADREFDNPDSTLVRNILHTTFRIMEMETFLNSKDRLNTDAAFWSDHGWEVKLDKQAERSTWWPLISNDGQSLVLIAVAPPFSNTMALRIYRKTGFRETTLIRTIPLQDLWTPAQIDGTGGIAHDSTPQWFAGGSLHFSPDDQSLIYRTQWSDELVIKLQDGAVSRTPTTSRSSLHSQTNQSD